MEIIKIKEKYERELINVKESILVYEVSSNHELRIACSTLKVEAEELNILVDALSKQMPIKVFTEYDDEFTCPSCNYFEDGIDVPTLKFCPDCGQKLQWD